MQVRILHAAVGGKSRSISATIATREARQKHLESLVIAAGLLMGVVAIAALLGMLRVLRQSRDEVRRLRRVIEYHFSRPKRRADADDTSDC